MKYFKETWNEEKRNWEKKEISKEEAEYILEGYYNNVDMLIDIPMYYRTMFGGIEITE